MLPDNSRNTRRRRCVVALTAAIFAATSSAALADTTVFTDDFTGGAKPQWSGGIGYQTPSSEWVLGDAANGGQPFGNASPTLTLTGLAPHTSYSLSLDFIAIYSNDGDEPFTITDSSGNTLQPATSFSGVSFNNQCFPHACPPQDQPPTTGSSGVVDLGYGTFYDSGHGYDLTYTGVSSSTGTLVITIAETASQGWSDEGWVLDNVAVTTNTASSGTKSCQGQSASEVSTDQGPAYVSPGVTVDDSGSNVVFTGTSGDDVIIGTDGADLINAGAGNDTVCARKGADRVNGQTGNDKIQGGDGADSLWGDAGNDTVRGISGNDKVVGGNGTDTLTGDAGNDRLRGGSGDDTLSGGSGSDDLDGDNGAPAFGFGTDSCDGGPQVDTFVNCEVITGAP